jgi:hypothetical protein
MESERVWVEARNIGPEVFKGMRHVELPVKGGLWVRYLIPNPSLEGEGIWLRPASGGKLHVGDGSVFEPNPLYLKSPG